MLVFSNLTGIMEVLMAVVCFRFRKKKDAVDTEGGRRDVAKLGE